MEHPHAAVADVILPTQLVEGADDGRVMIGPTHKALEANEISNVGFIVDLIPYTETKALIADIACYAPSLGKRLFSLMNQRLVCGARMRSEWEQQPVEANKITLSDQRDAAGVPLTSLQWKKSDLDRKTIEVGTNIIGEYLAQNSNGRLRLLEWLANKEGFPNNDQHAGWHHMGGTRMSDVANDGVVDRNCKVHKVDNLFVGGSSVFPTGGFANPTLSIVQLSLRLGDHLAMKLGKLG